MIKHLFLTVATLLCCINSSWAILLEVDEKRETANYKFEHLEEDRGFLQNSVLDIKQDRLGYMWYTTPNGIYKYDGYNFKIFYNEPNDDRTPEVNFISNVFTWVNGEVCFTNNNIINVYNSHSRDFQRIDTSIIESNDDRILNIVSDPDDSDVIWILSLNHIRILRLSNDLSAIEEILYDKRNDVNRPYSQMFRDDNDNVWLLSDGQVSCNRRGESNDVVEIFSRDIENTRSIIPDHLGDILVYSDGKITHIKNNDSQYSDADITEYSLKHAGRDITLKSINVSPGGNIIGVDWGHGVYIINLESREISFGAMSNVASANNRFLHNVSYIDNSGVLWIGTSLGGLYKTNLNRKNFKSIGEGGDVAYTNQITGDGDGNIYIGTHYGGVKHVNIQNSRLNQSDMNRALGISPDASVFAVHYHDGYLWYATTDGVINRAKLSHSGDVISHKKIYKANKGLGFFYRGASNRLYYSIFTAVNWRESNFLEEGNNVIYRCDNSSSERPTFSLLLDKSISIDGVGALLEDSRGDLWIGSNHQGLFKKKAGDLSIERVSLSDDISRNSIFSLHEDRNGNILVGSFGGGLVVIDADDSYKYYTRKDGLSNNAVYSILDGEDGSVWLSTDEGLSRFNIYDHSFQNYDTTDGILSTNSRKWSSWKSPTSGMMFFGGVNGVNYFFASEIYKNTYLPQIRITEFMVGDKEIDFESNSYILRNEREKRSNPGQIILKPSENDFRFEYAALHFENPQKHKYQYRLKGIDRSWINTTASSRSVSYSNISPGEYEFLVRGTNSDGVWSEAVTGVAFVVKPYWWQTWYAKTIYLLILITLTYLIFAYLIQRNKYKMDHQLNQAKLDFFTNISHEIKTPLTIISGVLEMGQSQEAISLKDLEIIRRNNKRMLALVSQLLDFRKVTQGHAPFTPTKENIVPLIENISESFMILASKNQLTYRLNVSVQQRELIFEADKVEKIVANLLSNAFKYTPQDGGVIELSLRAGLPDNLPQSIAKGIKHESDFYTTIAVKDNGDGIDPKHLDKLFDRFYQVGKYDLSLKNRGVGVGLAYSKMLTELHEGYLYVDSAVGVGSTFYLILPGKLSRVEPATDVVQNISARESVEFIITPKHAPASLEAESSSTQEKELLIVEDNQEIREFLREVLSPLYKIHEAADGREGLEMAERLIPDIIVSDVMMPYIDGITLCNKLKNGDKTEHIPIILLTANSTIDHRVEGIRSGADSYIPKPFNLEHLKVRIEKLLEIRTILKNKYMQQSGLVDLVDIEINSVDKEFLALVESVIENNLDDSEFTVEKLEDEMKYSHMQLYRKIKSISGVSVVEFIRNYRLKRSVDMMRQGHSRINEIMYSVGFATPSYFSKSFKKRYGKSPVEFIEELQNK